VSDLQSGKPAHSHIASAGLVPQAGVEQLLDKGIQPYFYASVLAALQCLFRAESEEGW
jgi:hypothetical protein